MRTVEARSPHPVIIIITDCRFPNEVTRLQVDYGFHVIRLNRADQLPHDFVPGYGTYERCCTICGLGPEVHPIWSGAAREHASEHSLPDESNDMVTYDHVITARSQQEANDAVLSYIASLLRRI
jgi:hypothetical protein